MTQQEILDYNKRCAEFLNLHRNDEVAIYKMSEYPYDFLKFHSDWNWIMEVCISLGMEFVTTNKEQLIQQIYDKLRSMETNS